MKKNIKILTILVLAIFLLLSLDAFAKRKRKKVNKKEVKKEVVLDDSSTKESSGWTIGLGGGYYVPMGYMADEVNPSWAGKLFFQKINKENTAGFGGDFTYSGLTDKETAGGVSYYMLLGKVFLNIEIKDVFDIQFGGGPGLSFLAADIDDGRTIESAYSLDFTVNGGFAIQRFFAEHYYVGLEATAYYYFEKNSTNSAALYFKAGYRF